jgi:hypothetical protein
MDRMAMIVTISSRSRRVGASVFQRVDLFAGGIR